MPLNAFQEKSTETSVLWVLKEVERVEYELWPARKKRRLGGKLSEGTSPEKELFDIFIKSK